MNKYWILKIEELSECLEIISLICENNIQIFNACYEYDLYKLDDFIQINAETDTVDVPHSIINSIKQINMVAMGRW